MVILNFDWLVVDSSVLFLKSLSKNHRTFVSFKISLELMFIITDITVCTFVCTDFPLLAFDLTKLCDTCSIR